MPEYKFGNMEDFQKELQRLLNKHSIDAYCETPDFILAAYLVENLEIFSGTVKWTSRWKEPRPTVELGQE